MATIVGREKQLNKLLNLIDNQINFGLIIAHGQSSSGKSLVVNHVLKQKNINHVYVQCRCIATSKQFYDILLNGIHEMHNNNENNENFELKGWRKYSQSTQCTSGITFAHILENEDISNKTSFYIVLDHFQRLELVEQGMISNLIQIQEIQSLVQNVCKIGFILIGNSSCMVDLHQFLGNKRDCVIPIYFEQYQTNELQSILLQSTQSIFESVNISANFAKHIIRHLCSSFSYEERRIDIFHKYIALLMPEIIKVYNRTDMKQDSNQFTSQCNNLILNLFEKLHQSQQRTIDFTSHNSLFLNIKKREPDLPYASKLVLLATYLASYNSRKFNEYQFTSHKQKMSKRKKRTGKVGAKYALKFTGARSFDLQELSGIFITLFNREAPLHKKISHIHDLHSQIAHLVSLSFISIVSKKGSLDDIKLKCNIDEDYSHFLARKMRIEKWELYLEATALAY